MDMYNFLDRLLYPEYTYVVIDDLQTNKTIMRGFVDDLLLQSKTLIMKYNVVTFGITDEDTIYINARTKENEDKYI